ncbi:xanthine dehydrogenase family protein molybdopterin-binding subunit [Mycolicibacterium goodii]|uniref:xanthine dehydrogenase family protein molybdopterin-binding subunit n=1 Tax=Mycolicibacterium goodii TaxID=134601 RepID=UPI001BDCEF0C|nr:xanthine dehydrogenase family protein molybdopterin-binding subunit [Mycolicibacterium goodii]MBU8831030.1 xanthine dehydrogenase family protein molybdopterin-binding subunit [Mycolicibacterium goodii]
MDTTTDPGRWPKRHALEFATGQAVFVDDIRPQGMLHMAVVRSMRAHARILSVDTSAAKAHPGVVRVLDAHEAALHLDTLPYQFGEPELLGARRVDLPALPRDRVRYIGEPIAVLAAENPRAARAAAAAVEIEYDELPTAPEPREYLGTPTLSVEQRNHVITENHFTSGDPDDALCRAVHVLDTDFTVGRSTTAPLETRGYVASWDPCAKRLTVHASHQQPFQLRSELADVLRLPVEAIHVVVPNVGGSFGLKMTGQVEEPLVCLLSILCGRPVKWMETRAECFLGGGREQIHRVRVGFDDTGRVNAFTDDMVVPVGARSVSPGWRQAYVSAASFPGPYDIAHVDIRSRVVATHVPPWHSCRGFGKEAPVFVMERVMDLIARRLRLDPADVRRRNLLPSSAFPHRLPSGYRIDSGDYHAVLDQALDVAGYGKADRHPTSTVRRGVGISFEITPEGGGHASGRLAPGVTPTVAAPEAATVRVDRDGHVTVFSGVTNPGGGNDTALARLAAETLGTTPANVTVIQGDTALCPPGTGNASSRGVAVGGPAVVLAATDVADTLRRTAAIVLGCAPQDVTLAGDAAHAPGRAPVQLRELCACVTDSGELSSTRSYCPTPPDDPAYRYSYPYFSSGAYVAEVDVDTATGVVTVRAVTAVHDCGRVIEPVLVEGQLQGAIAMGIGLAMFEDSRFDSDGSPSTRTFKEYLVARANDLPDFVIRHHETPSPYTLLGAKGAGEAGVGGALAAVANAIDDAIHHAVHGAGDAVATVTSVPLDPPTVLAMIPEHASRGDT